MSPESGPCNRWQQRQSAKRTRPLPPCPLPPVGPGEASTTGVKGFPQRDPPTATSHPRKPYGSPQPSWERYGCPLIPVVTSGGSMGGRGHGSPSPPPRGSPVWQDMLLPRDTWRPGLRACPRRTGGPPGDEGASPVSRMTRRRRRLAWLCRWLVGGGGSVQGCEGGVVEVAVCGEG